MERVEDVLKVYKKEKVPRKIKLCPLYIEELLGLSKVQAHKLTYLSIVKR